MTADGKGTRAYRSERRTEQARRTRARILAAARSAFLASGYDAATLPGVAAAAGVSVKTVEAAFGTKGRLLKAVVDVAIAGDDLPVAVLQREAVRAAEAAADPTDFLALLGLAVAAVADRVAGLLLVVDRAVGADDGVAAVAAQLDGQRRVMAAWVVANLGRRARLRPGLGTERAVDTVWLLMDPVVHRRLTRDRRWSAEDFQAWFADSVHLLVLAPAAPADRLGPGS